MGSTGKDSGQEKLNFRTVLLKFVHFVGFSGAGGVGKMEYRYFVQVPYAEIPMRTVLVLLQEYQLPLCNSSFPHQPL